MPNSSTKQDMRIAKYIARAGICSRRDAEKIILAKRITLNGKTLTSPAINVSQTDTILLDGKPLPQIEPTRLFRFHKPVGCLTAEKDPENRATIFDKLRDNFPYDLPRLVSVGRLDFNTQGLLLLTNDGELARHLELPSTGWLRKYKVRAFGTITQSELDSLANGIAVDGILYGAINATLDKQQQSNVWLTLTMREGKNREVKKVLEHLGLQVNRLIRISYGPFHLRDLAIGDVAEVRSKILQQQLGDKYANHRR